jgi:hypothetical protein
MASCAHQVTPAGPSAGRTSAPPANSGPSTPAAPATNSTSKPHPTVKDRPHGNIKQHAKTHKINYRKRIELTGSAKFASGVAVTVTKVRPVDARAVGPGEVGGPALALTVKVTNGSNDTLDLSTVTVDLSGADKAPGILTSGDPSKPLRGTLEPDDSALGTYVFTIAKANRKPVTVQVQYGNGQTVLQFSGNA